MNAAGGQSGARVKSPSDGWLAAASVLVSDRLQYLRDLHDGDEPTLYDIFFDLLPLTRDALRENSAAPDNILPRGFAFAEWCHRHQERYIWNAAGVAFYEHLCDEAGDIEAVAEWLSPEAADSHEDLIRMHSGDENYARLNLALEKRTAFHYRKALALLEEQRPLWEKP